MDLSEIQDASEHRHPWEISRAQSISNLSKEIRYDSIADIGSGDLYFAGKVSNETGTMVYACDIHYKKEELTQVGRIKTVSDIQEIPSRTIDLVFLLDVLEHVEDESTFIKEVVTLLSLEGRIILTVPAFQFLFGEHDVFLQHFRRYNKSSLKKVLEENDLVVEKVFYFYSSLFAIKVLQKCLSTLGIQTKYENSVSSWQYPRKHFLTRFFVFLLNTDFVVNRFLHSTFKITLPGLSLCAIVKKPA